jgi:hypothetical protein
MAAQPLTYKGETWTWTQYHKWSERVQSGYGFKHPELQLIRPDTHLYCMGSCFADNVAIYLRARLGMDAKSFVESRLYDTASILQTVKHLLVEPQYGDEDMFTTVDGRFAHPFRNWRFRANSVEELTAWGKQIEDDARAGLANSNVVIITLGGTETWRNPTTKKTYITMPMSDVFNHQPELMEYHDLTYEENYANLEEIYLTLRDRIPGMRLIYTVSPIRMSFTMGEKDVAVATTNAKSILRAAVGRLVDNYAAAGDLHYFHSYESIMCSPHPEIVWTADNVHVTEGAVWAVMHEFSRCFLHPEARGAEFEFERGVVEAVGTFDDVQELRPFAFLAVRRFAVRALRTLHFERTARRLLRRPLAGAR